MAAAYPSSDEDDLSSAFNQMDIEVMGLISRSYKNKAQLCFLGFYYRKKHESRLSEGIYIYSILFKKYISIFSKNLYIRESYLALL